MVKQKKELNILYPILVFWMNRNAFFSFLFLIALPLFVIPSVIGGFAGPFPFDHLVSSVFVGIAYFLMFLFIVSFSVLYKTSREIEIPFRKTLKLIPEISKKTALTTGVFALLITLSKELFFLAPYALLIVFPIISFLPTYKSSVETKALFVENKKYLNSKAGKSLIGKMIVLAILLLIAVGITTFILDTIFSFVYNRFMFQVLYAIKMFLRLCLFFILYLSANIYYVNENFLISKELNIVAVNIWSEKKRERQKRKTKTRKESKQNERNRFEQDDEYNRFNNTNF